MIQRISHLSIKLAIPLKGMERSYKERQSRLFSLSTTANPPPHPPHKKCLKKAEGFTFIAQGTRNIWPDGQNVVSTNFPQSVL